MAADGCKRHESARFDVMGLMRLCASVSREAKGGCTRCGPQLHGTQAPKLASEPDSRAHIAANGVQYDCRSLQIPALRKINEMLRRFLRDLSDRRNPFATIFAARIGRALPNPVESHNEQRFGRGLS